MLEVGVQGPFPGPLQPSDAGPEAAAQLPDEERAAPGFLGHPGGLGAAASGPSAAQEGPGQGFGLGPGDALHGNLRHLRAFFGQAALEGPERRGGLALAGAVGEHRQHGRRVRDPQQVGKQGGAVRIPPLQVLQDQRQGVPGAHAHEQFPQGGEGPAAQFLGIRGRRRQARLGGPGRRRLQHREQAGQAKDVPGHAESAALGSGSRSRCSARFSIRLSRAWYGAEPSSPHRPARTTVPGSSRPSRRTKRRSR